METPMSIASKGRQDALSESFYFLETNKEIKGELYFSLYLKLKIEFDYYVLSDNGSVKLLKALESIAEGKKTDEKDFLLSFYGKDYTVLNFLIDHLLLPKTEKKK